MMELRRDKLDVGVWRCSRVVEAGDEPANSRRGAGTALRNHGNDAPGMKYVAVEWRYWQPFTIMHNICETDDGCVSQLASHASRRKAACAGRAAWLRRDAAGRHAAGQASPIATCAQQAVFICMQDYTYVGKYNCQAACARTARPRMQTCASEVALHEPLSTPPICLNQILPSSRVS
jgi:hypothetical protein